MPPLPTADTAGVTSISTGVQSSFLGVHAINVYVRDQDKSIEFFVGKLGFRLAFDGRLQSGDRWVAVTPPDGTTVLALVVPKADSQQGQLIGQPTGIVFLSENVIAKYNQWRERGVRFLLTPRLRRVKYGRRAASVTDSTSEEQSPVWGGVFTRFLDNDGNSFALVGLDEANREIEAQRRRVAEKLELERRTAQELEIARQVQARLFPQGPPRVQSLDYGGICIQARQVGGDYHDFLNLGRGRYGLVIADIAGKGIAAALLMANLQANLRSQCAIASDDPERLLRSVNQLFYDNTDESAYATLFFAEYDDKSGRIRYANCGHLPPLLLRYDGAIEKLDSTCTVLGLFEQWECSIAEHRLFPGDTLVLYTDGITEAFDPAGEEFGQHRLIQALLRHRGLEPQAAISSIVDEVENFSSHQHHDDITLIIAKCKGGEPLPLFG